MRRAKVLTHMCMSLDGFVAQPDDNPAELFDRYWNGGVVVPSAQQGMSFSLTLYLTERGGNAS
jgi:hypothetical protein